MYITGVGQAVLELLRFKVVRESPKGNLLTSEFLENLRNMRLVSLKMTSHLTSDNFQILLVDIFSKPCLHELVT